MARVWRGVPRWRRSRRTRGPPNPLHNLSVLPAPPLPPRPRGPVSLCRRGCEENIHIVICGIALFENSIRHAIVLDCPGNASWALFMRHYLENSNKHSLPNRVFEKFYCVAGYLPKGKLGHRTRGRREETRGRRARALGRNARRRFRA